MSHNQNHPFHPTVIFPTSPFIEKYTMELKHNVVLMKQLHFVASASVFVVMITLLAALATESPTCRSLIMACTSISSTNVTTHTNAMLAASSNIHTKQCTDQSDSAYFNQVLFGLILAVFAFDMFMWWIYHSFLLRLKVAVVKVCKEFPVEFYNSMLNDFPCDLALKPLMLSAIKRSSYARIFVSIFKEIVQEIGTKEGNVTQRGKR